VIKALRFFTGWGLVMGKKGVRGLSVEKMCKNVYILVQILI